MKLILGTHKGLIQYEKTKAGWQFLKDDFLGIGVSMFYNDEQSGQWFAGLSHGHWGEKLHCSNDEGKTWIELNPPAFPEGADEIEDGVKPSVQLFWSMNRCGKSLFIGTVPGALFESKDDGATFTLVESLWNHKSRKLYWFGGGFKYPGIHSIEVHPTETERFFIGISCAGTFETTDMGKGWIVRNDGVTADYLPKPDVEVGQDPHRLLLCKSTPAVMWQQNHCGIWRTEDAGKNWTNVTDKNQLALFGFALYIDDNNPLRAWVIPAISDEIRVTVKHSLVVCETKDGGKTWQENREGLPQKDCYDLIYRHAFDGLNETMVFATTTGNLFTSDDYGKSWTLVNAFLPMVKTVNLVDS